MTQTKPKATFKQTVEYWAAKAFIAFFGALPFPLASGLGGVIGRTIGPLVKRPTRTARDNLTKAFPEKSPAEIERILGDMWEHLGRHMGEWPHLPKLDLYNDSRFEVIGKEHLEALRDDDAAGLAVGAHLGPWECMPYLFTQIDLPIHSIYRAPNNPLLEEIYDTRLPSKDAPLIPKGPKGARMALKILSDGGHVGILIDQKMNDGIPVPFFGRDAMTAPALAQFALKFNCPVVPVRAERVKKCHFRFTIYPPMEFDLTGDRHEDVAIIMTAVNAMLEGWVRERPEQWFWVHSRWPK